MSELNIRELADTLTDDEWLFGERHHKTLIPPTPYPKWRFTHEEFAAVLAHVRELAAGLTPAQARGLRSGLPRENTRRSLCRLGLWVERRMAGNGYIDIIDDVSSKGRAVLRVLQEKLDA